jgi:hypothetical protein
MRIHKVQKEKVTQLWIILLGSTRNFTVKTLEKLSKTMVFLLALSVSP